MPNVVPTTITTGKRDGFADLAIGDGFALFPWLGYKRGPMALDDDEGMIFDKTLNLEIFKIELYAGHKEFKGDAGPSVAFEFNTDEATNFTVPEPGQPSSGSLVIGDHTIRAGHQSGIQFEVDAGLVITANFIFYKKKLLNIDAQVRIDVMELIKILLMALYDQGKAALAGPTAPDDGGSEVEDSTISTTPDEPSPDDEDTDDDDPGNDEGEQIGLDEGDSSGQAKGTTPSAKPTPHFTGTGVVAKSVNPFALADGTSSAGNPTHTVDLDLAFGVSVVPLLSGVPVLDALYAIDEGLKPLGGGFEFGPQINVGLPTKVSVTGATISNHPFDITGSQPGDKPGTTEFLLTERSPSDPQLQPLRATADEIGVLLEQHTEIDAGLSFFFEFTFFKVAHISGSTGELHLFYQSIPDGGGGPFDNQLSFVPGGGPVPFAAPAGSPTVSGFTANQPQASWKNGVLARYGVSFYDANYETEIGSFTAYDPESRFFAFGELTDLPIGPAATTPVLGRRIYRQFNDGSLPVQVGDIADNTTTTFTDTTP